MAASLTVNSSTFYLTQGAVISRDQGSLPMVGHTDLRDSESKYGLAAMAMVSKGRQRDRTIVSTLLRGFNIGLHSPLALSLIPSPTYVDFKRKLGRLN